MMRPCFITALYKYVHRPFTPLYSLVTARQEPPNWSGELAPALFQKIRHVALHPAQNRHMCQHNTALTFIIWTRSRELEFEAEISAHAQYDDILVEISSFE